jgi:hypothetical protein
MSNETEKPNEFEIACDDYVSKVSPEIQSKIDYEIRQAFLAGVTFGIKKAQEVYTS